MTEYARFVFNWRNKIIALSITDTPKNYNVLVQVDQNGEIFSEHFLFTRMEYLENKFIFDSIKHIAIDRMNLHHEIDMFEKAYDLP